jgi:hypothetical protein
MIHDCIFILRDDFLHEEIEPVVYALRYWLHVKSMKNLTKHEEHKITYIENVHYNTKHASALYSVFFVPCLILEGKQ